MPSFDETAKSPLSRVGDPAYKKRVGILPVLLWAA
jgi:hypothetical protein